MRYQSSVTSLSWIPSEAVQGGTRLPFDVGMAHYDQAPPDEIDDLDSLRVAAFDSYRTPKRDQGDRNSPWARRSFGKRRIYLCQREAGPFRNPPKDLQDRLASSEIIDVENRPPSDKVIFGSRVTIEDVDTNEKKIYQILGQDDADIGRGIISVDSPLGRALIGKQEQDFVEVKTPNGVREYEILEIA